MNRITKLSGNYGILFLLAMLATFVLVADKAWGQAEELPDAKRVPAVQVRPLPHDQASFQYFGMELTRYHFAPTLQRPFCYPMNARIGGSLTRMGHPHAPMDHSHHNSVWISHNDVEGINFWIDHAENQGRIVHQRIEQYGEDESEAWLLAVNAWKSSEGKVLLLERRRIGVLVDPDYSAIRLPRSAGERRLNNEFPPVWQMSIDLQFETPPGEGTVTLRKTPFGVIGVRMAKTIGVRDGGGRILNSEGQRNEKEVFRKRVRWVDYSGPVGLYATFPVRGPIGSPMATGGITLMDHPINPGHPTAFHVRGDGWMGVCLTLDRPIKIEPGKPLRLRYGLRMHNGIPKPNQIEAAWKTFAKRPLPTMQRRR